MTDPTAAERDLLSRVEAIVTATPGVAGLHAGTFGTATTVFPGERVVGVVLHPDRAEIHVTVWMGEDCRAIGNAVRDRVQPMVGTPVDVYVDDVIAEGMVTAAPNGDEVA